MVDKRLNKMRLASEAAALKGVKLVGTVSEIIENEIERAWKISEMNRLYVHVHVPEKAAIAGNLAGKLDALRWALKVVKKESGE